MRKHDLILSLTSYPPRMPIAATCVDSLLRQSLRPGRTILWLAPEEFPSGEKDLPPDLLAQKDRGLEIRWTRNTRSYKKLIPALREFGDKIIVTADDDAIYSEGWLESLYADYRRRNDAKTVYAHRAHHITFTPQGKIAPYRDWIFMYADTTPSCLNLATGLGGILYPPGCLHREVLNEQAALELAPAADDLFFWAMAVLNGSQVRVTSEILRPRRIATHETHTLWHENMRGGNDRQLGALLERYEKVGLTVLAAGKAELEKTLAAARKSGCESGEDFNSAAYWENRYRAGGNSGAGSYGRLSEFKAGVINDFIREHAVQSAVEFGAGDGNQLSLYHIPGYIGFDVSADAVRRLRKRFGDDASKCFLHTSEYTDQRAELGLSIDVIFHLVEDAVFDVYMNNLFAAAEKYVIIYSSNIDAAHPTALHVRHRKFTRWIKENRPDWKCVRYIQNPYPVQFFGDENPDRSFCDFYIFAREDGSRG